MPRYTITNFSRGEFGPQLYGRVDIPQYNAGAKELTNFIIQRYGGVAFRPGFRFVGEVDSANDEFKFIPFQQSIEQAYVLGFAGNGFFTPLADGGIIADEDLKITAITKAASAKITAANHSLNVTDRIYIDGIVGMTQMNGRHTYVLGVVDANNFTVPIDSTGFSTFVSSSGIVRAAPPPPPPTTPPPVSSTPQPPITTSPTPSEPSPDPTKSYYGPGTYRGNIQPRTILN